MIRSFRDKRTEAVANGTIKKGFPSDLIRRAQQMLTAIEAAQEVNDLRFPPGNGLEKLSGERDGQYSVRLNKQWRICFVWTEGGAEDAEITDYH